MYLPVVCLVLSCRTNKLALTSAASNWLYFYKALLYRTSYL